MIERVTTVFLLVLATGCVQTRTTVHPDFARVQKPVSASAAYLTRRGEIVTGAGYVELQPFSLSKEFETPVDEQLDHRFDLAPELNRLMRTLGADAFVNVQVQIEELRNGTTAGRTLVQRHGAAGMIVGALRLPMDATQRSADGAFVIPALSIGIGAGFYLIGLLSDAPARIRVRVSGQAVRRKPTPVASAAASPGNVGTPPTADGTVPTAPSVEAAPSSTPAQSE